MTRLVIIHSDGAYREAAWRALATGLADVSVCCGASLEDVAFLVDDAAAAGLVLAEIHGTVRATVGALLPCRRQRPRLRFAIVGPRVTRRDLQDCMAAGIAGFVLRDLPADRLVGAVRSMLAGAEFVPPGVGGAPFASTGGPCGRPAGPQPDPDRLTGRQRDVLKLLAIGMSNRNIGATLGIAEATAKIHVGAVLRVLGVKQRSAVREAIAALAGDPRWAEALGEAAAAPPLAARGLAPGRTNSRHGGVPSRPRFWRA